MNYISTYAISLFVFLSIDAVWLGVIAKSLYRNNIGHLLADSPNWLAAAIFYPLFVVGITVFVTMPALSNNTAVLKAVALAFLFGFICYATYDFTNQATLKDWPWLITLIDVLWGGTITAATVAATLWISKFFN